MDSHTFYQTKFLMKCVITTTILKICMLFKVEKIRLTLVIGGGSEAHVSIMHVENLTN
jgi:hypothetical protein